MNGATRKRMSVFWSVGTPYFSSVKWKTFRCRMNSDAIRLCFAGVFKTFESSNKINL